MQDELTGEVRELCRRLLGDGTAAGDAAAAALSNGATARVELLTLAITECRARVDQQVHPPPSTAPSTLAEAITAELTVANAALAADQREVLAMRELLGLSHAEIAAASGSDENAVALLLASARLTLRTELRAMPPDDGCPERERGLRILVRRQDGEAVGDADDVWIREHMGGCPECERHHAAMLEASVRYHAWKPG
jgi:Sigma-70, region 4